MKSTDYSLTCDEWAGAAMSQTQADPFEIDDLKLRSPTPEATYDIGARLGTALEPGDLVTLSGPFGAGKSHLARAAIKAKLGSTEVHVPSPSYTLVNVYAHEDGDIWHADLYRLGAPDEMDEIGLQDALSDAVVLVEWPDRWADLPPRRLAIELKVTGQDSRALAIKALGGGWGPVLSALKAC
ncbi:MAG: tRNA (adenosine(37)-N6)-threonylcarbamoyltransferase complex ATPase subunit type 1 TsaE [Pseudomonadota bacterium]